MLFLLVFLNLFLVFFMEFSVALEAAPAIVNAFFGALRVLRTSVLDSAVVAIFFALLLAFTKVALFGARLFVVHLLIMMIMMSAFSPHSALFTITVLDRYALALAFQAEVIGMKTVAVSDAESISSICLLGRSAFGLLFFGLVTMAFAARLALFAFFLWAFGVFWTSMLRITVLT